MSSHHIVRDEQEPALLVVDHQGYSEMIGQLLEWSPVVVAVAPMVERVVSWGCKVDVAICEPGLRPLMEQTLQDQIPYIIWSPQAAEWLTECGLRELAEGGHQAVNVLLEDINSGMHIWDQWASRLDLVLYDSNCRWIRTHTSVFQKWMPKQAVINISNPQAIKSTDNIAPIGDNQWRVQVDGAITIKLKRAIWIGEIL